MSQSLLRQMPRALRPTFLAAGLLLAACGDANPTEQPPPPVAPVDAGIMGMSSPNAVVCVRDTAGTTWCSRADTGGLFRVTGGSVAPGTGRGPIPARGVVAVFTVDCPAREVLVDRDGPRRNGGAEVDVSCQPAGCMPQPSGLLAWYTFDETAGDSAADLANPGTGDAARLFDTRPVPGRVLGGLDLSETSAYAQAPATRNVGTGDFSIAMWIRLGPNGTRGFFTLLDKRDEDPIRGYHMVLGFGEPLIQLADAGEYDGWYNYHSGIFDKLTADRWHHLAVTVQRASAEGVRWYVDGEPAGVVGDPRGRQGSLDSAAPLLIGRHAFHGSSGMDGAMDELMIIDRALTPGEVVALRARAFCR